MAKIRIENKESFTLSGRKTWISEQDNEQFAIFWAKCHENGFVDKLKKATDPLTNITKSSVIGVSRVENDPNNRAFDFYVASECQLNDEESFNIAAQKWAIFSSDDDGIKGLIDSEMECFMNWLPNSDYVHDLAPELEVYPVSGSKVEFWLPIKEK